MPPIIMLCVQLAIASSTSWMGVWATPDRQASASVQDVPRLVFPLPPSAAVPSTASRVNVVSKRQATLIDSDDSFSFRQHHQPPAPRLQPELLITDGFYKRHHDSPQFRQLHQQDQSSNHPAGSLNYHRHNPHPHPYGSDSAMKDPMAELLEQQEYDQQPQEFNAALHPFGVENEIDHNTFRAIDSVDSSENNPGRSSLNNLGNKPNIVESIDLIRARLERSREQEEEEDIEMKSNLLVRLLEQMPEGPLPIVYIEDASGSANPAASSVGTDDSDDDNDDADQPNEFTSSGNKRSGRYYRRYPWKRQNARSRTYDADARYLCVPSREDVFKLLVGLHENRIGNHQKTINFCNRKRPAKAIFTNIRFLG
ncbi:uncharacterized protein LOC129779519 [Toxorhynchites rutilus septentrionalis]|uniref:uncharacterized protein LOC129779519 n=1 Tax=Toxorhynchites rutilus septentrionalis TaxID=329112 RepID=UPI002478CBD4|nr:uncharacterized protein LOC129779519 [Toxorhynchites rutilus septentrionalis]XP_055643015.1 uncharacterized protein LOC129779519 [Toxorhynchites rutilus septentrionalis]XP_055643016.1 uncharacterized protein LOC129779519 [Toxorhynchites rutilus septentrionalis]